MISSVHIKGYRALADFTMTDLGRINLLVGTNNSGKTSLLEAIYLLYSSGDPASLWHLLWRRGERLPSTMLPAGDRVPRRSAVELDVTRLFLGNDVLPGCRFSIAAIAANGTTKDSVRAIECTLAEQSPDQPDLFTDDDNGLASRLALNLSGNPKPPVEVVPLSRSGGLTAEGVDFAGRRTRLRSTAPPLAQFVTTESLSADDLVSMWNRIALTPYENLALQALQFLDPEIERIAVQVAGSAYYGLQPRAGFIVKRKHWDQPVPIGSMGDGVWRILALAIAITQCKGGVLLVDEIDTGLHYSVMERMWTLIFRAANEFDVQVFATTHSYDCVHSLAQLCSDSDTQASVSVQRIERDKKRSVPYDSDELVAVASKNIEVR